MVGYDAVKGVLSSRDIVMASCASGFISRLVVQPLDVVKIRFQLQVEPVGKGTCAKYSSLLQAFRLIIKEEGTRALLKGHTPAQVQAILFSFIQFASFEFLTEKMPYIDTGSSLGHFSCGCIAGAYASIVTQPFDVLRTRFIAQGEPKVYSNMFTALFMMVKQEGVPGLFRGLVPSLLLISPQTGLQFTFYKVFNDIYSSLSHKISSYLFSGKETITSNEEIPFVNAKRNVGVIQSLFTGCLSGMASKACIYPLDFVKKRMQVQGFEKARAKFGKLHQSTGFYNCFLVILREEGAMAFFKGLKPGMVKAGLSIAVRFAAYEQLCNFLRVPSIGQ